MHDPVRAVGVGDVRSEDRQHPLMRSRWRYAFDALAMALAFAVCLLALEAFHTWQRVNALFAWAQQVQASAAPPRPAPQMPPAEAPNAAPKK